MARQLTPAVVKEWLELATGIFDIRQMHSDIGIDTPENKSHLRVILYRIEHEGIIANLGNGKYRKLDTKVEEMNWQIADPNKIVPLHFPFGLEEVCRIFPKSIIILAGSKNEGKTAFLYDFISRNMASFCIDLFNSETGPEQMKERFEPLAIPNPAPFKTYERYNNFADVINPDHISVIDYLDLNSEVYLIGTEIDAIFHKLKTGVAIIGLQKPPPTKALFRGKETIIERDLAYGGGFSAKRAVLYISLGSHKLKLIYVKNPIKKNVNPKNMTWSYDFDENGYFTNIQRYFGEDTL